MRQVRPPPRVVVASKNSNEAEPRLSDWKREGYPSEFAYAKALGMLEISKPMATKEITAQPDHDVRYKHPESAAHAIADYDYEADVQREMKKLEEGLKLMLNEQEQSGRPNIYNAERDVNQVRIIEY